MSDTPEHDELPVGSYPAGDSPDDEPPLYSEPVLTEEETSRQLRADACRGYTDRIAYLERRLIAMTRERDEALEMVSVAREAMGAIESTLGHGFFPDVTELQKLTDALARLDEIEKEANEPL